MNGRETYEKIIAIHPGQKAIISSGFSRDTEVKATQRLGAGGFISKPFTIEQLAKIVFNGLHATVPSPHIP
ncbi:response regulator transcription factor, partial [Desulfoprunum benzoelyticum]